MYTEFSNPNDSYTQMTTELLLKWKKFTILVL